MDLSPTTTAHLPGAGRDRRSARGSGKVPLTALTRQAPRRPLRRDEGRPGRSPKTIRNHHAIISSALHQAVRWGWVRDKRRREGEAAAGLAAPGQGSLGRGRPGSHRGGRGARPRLAPLLMLAALTGMRRGELCALRWTDVDLERGSSTCRESVVVVPGGLAEKTTKTDRSAGVWPRSVGVPLLVQHQWLNVMDGPRRLTRASPTDAFVFSPFFDGTKPFRPDNVTGFFIRVRDSVGAKRVRLHDLRHFTATQLIGAGVDVRTVAGRLGHSDPSLTLRVYAPVIEDRDRAAAAIMGEVLGPTKKKAARAAR